MAWRNNLAQQWDQLVKQGGGLLSTQLPSGTLEADLPTVNALGCECRSFVITTPRLAGADAARLTQLGNQLAQQLNYLMEPIRVIELDGQAHVLQMRSVPPTTQGHVRFYYEVLVKAVGSISVQRYQASSGQPRQNVPAILTREVFERLAGDVVAALP